MEDVCLDLEWYLTHPDEKAEDPFYVEPQGMVDTALRELGASLVAVEHELPDPEE
jgi:hypothetical protein